MQATVPNMHKERAWNSVTGRSVQAVRGSDGAGHRRLTFDDGVLAVCFLSLIGVVVLGGFLMLFSWVVATLPTRPMSACPQFDGCVVPAADEGQAKGADESRIDGPKMTP
jgi:hypothetical protein